ncbi:MAG: pyrroline-5-carboxylate reductase [Geminicoccaceae bacterium]|nr:pyrroline-5-carboxylate reductase [Geminicoccaceae bacterium]
MAAVDLQARLQAVLDGPLVLVGGGRMGAALLRGWLDRGLSSKDVVVVEPDTAIRETLAVHDLGGLHAGADEIDAPSPGVLVLAVKPQVMDAVLADHVDRVGPSTLVVSIAAGKPLATFEAAFGSAQPIVRVMPNTPASVGCGMSVLIANAAVDEAQRAAAEALMQAVGRTAWIEDEELMHAVTGLSGSGPAYVFHMCEAMTAAGIQAGLPVELATMLARQTIYGAGVLLERSDDDAAKLRADVTSPGGTTQAGLEVWMAEGAVEKLMGATVAAAARRSAELA